MIFIKKEIINLEESAKVLAKSINLNFRCERAKLFIDMPVGFLFNINEKIADFYLK